MTIGTETPAVLFEAVQFGWPGQQRPCLDIENFVLGPGEKLFLAGPSGSGKSTLLSLVAGIIKPVAGRAHVLGTDLASLSGPARDRFRADRMGVVFQMFNLLPYLSVLENITLPCRFSRVRRERAMQAAGDPAADAKRLLAHLGLGDAEFAQRRASDLSVGQQQRVAAARALIGRPDLVIADEPTSALDADTRDAFIALLVAECEAAGAALLFVSHDRSLAARFDRVVELPLLNRVEG